MSAIQLPAPAGVILADPPWRYTNFRKSEHGAASHHYGTMSGEALAALPVDSWAAKDSVLALWSTVTHLPVAIRCMEAWGFTYTTKIAWVKTVPSSGTIRRGIGHWAMACHEDLLIGTRGEPPRMDTRQGTPLGLLTGDRHSGEEVVFYAPIGDHSEKPLEMHAWLERSRRGPFLELFARRGREGWTCWGNELGVELTPEGARACSPPDLEAGSPQGRLF